MAPYHLAHGLDNYGTVDNSGTIRVGNTSAVGAIGILHRNGGTFNNKPNAAIYIDQTGGAQAFYSNGLVNNEALIKIGSLAAVTGEGIRLEGNTFNNKTGGNIQIDQTGSYGIRLDNSGTVFNNEALIEIGSQSDVKGDGIRNGSTFNNKVGGDIYINRIGISGNTVFCIINSGTFNNDAKITIGNIGLVFVQDGIYNAGSFTNSGTGIISIAKPWGNGLWNVSGTFQNAGQITISNVFNVSEGEFSTGILSTALDIAIEERVRIIDVKATGERLGKQAKEEVIVVLEDGRTAISDKYIFKKFIGQSVVLEIKKLTLKSGEVKYSLSFPTRWQRNRKELNDAILKSGGFPGKYFYDEYLRSKANGKEYEFKVRGNVVNRELYENEFRAIWNKQCEYYKDELLDHPQYKNAIEAIVPINNKEEKERWKKKELGPAPY